MAHSTAMSRHALLAVATALVVAGCSGSASEGERPDQGAGVTMTVPPTRLTPFCQAMIDLADRLETEQIDDEGQLILDTYLDILSEVPTAIEEDFRVVIARLQSGDLPELATTSTTRPGSRSATATTSTVGRSPGGSASTRSTTTTTATTTTTTTTTHGTLADAEYEGWTPDDDPAIRVNGYVDFVCRDNLNNPGPAASQPEPPELSGTEDTAGTAATSDTVGAGG